MDLMDEACGAMWASTMNNVVYRLDGDGKTKYLGELLNIPARSQSVGPMHLNE